jgi:hypothetical protein
VPGIITFKAAINGSLQRHPGERNIVNEIQISEEYRYAHAALEDGVVRIENLDENIVCLFNPGYFTRFFTGPK